jgi:hypothetical protein
MFYYLNNYILSWTSEGRGGRGEMGKKGVYVMAMAIMLVTALRNKEAER